MATAASSARSSMPAAHDAALDRLQAARLLKLATTGNIDAVVIGEYERVFAAQRTSVDRVVEPGQYTPHLSTRFPAPYRDWSSVRYLSSAAGSTGRSLLPTSGSETALPQNGDGA